MRFTKKLIPIFAVLTIFAVAVMPAFSAFAGTTVNYPKDYTWCSFPNYHDDWFANASGTPTNAAGQSGAATTMFHYAFNTSATPSYTNLWGTYSRSQHGAHEGIDMVYGGKGQPVYSWVKSGTVKITQSDIGLVTIYYAALDRTIFYRHLDSINVSVGQHVVKGTLIGKEGKNGNATGVHLHTAVMDGNVSSETADDSYFASSNPYSTITRMYN